MNPRDVAISYGTAESTKSGTDPDMLPLEDNKHMSRSTSDGLFTGILLLKPLRLRCTFAASCDVQLSRQDVSFIEVTRGCQWGESVGCQPTLRTIPAGEAMMRVDV